MDVDFDIDVEVDHFRYKHLFEWRIWDRGVQYFREGRVKQLARETLGYSAEVMGTEDYNVFIFIDSLNGGVEDMVCDCPYAVAGNDCKHMAAVLLEINRMVPEEEKWAGAVSQETFNRVIQKIEMEEMLQFFTEELQRIPALKEAFYRKYCRYFLLENKERKTK